MANSYILVVDDQMGVRRLIQETLQEEGYQVDVASSGTEALEKARAKEPAAILLDMKMPGMNGLETMRRMQEFKVKAPVILMTAYGELEIVAEALQMGVREYITKPFDINELRLLVRKVLEQAS